MHQADRAIRGNSSRGCFHIRIVRGCRVWLDHRIKTLNTLLVVLLLALTSASAGDFAKTLTPEKIRAAGLAKLTPEEMAELVALVEQYKNADPAGAPDAAPARQEPSEAKPGHALPKWVAALITLERTVSQPDEAGVLESRLKGEFDGWSGRTSFRLENGQIWGQANHDHYDYSPILKSPKVKVYPASVGTYWLEIENVNRRCRVKPVKME